MTIDDQMEILCRGAVDVVPREALAAKLENAQKSGKPLHVKLGLDPTAPDIHLGNAVVLRKLRHFQNLGHQVTVIIGDFTAMIGDPTERSETRKQLSPEEVALNARTYAEQYHKILDPSKTTVRFNGEWLGKLKLYDVMTLMAKTTVARILERDDFTKRYNGGVPIHTHELLYPICQAYDSVVLKSDVELGGTEQRFNIMMGRDLQREHGEAQPQVGLFMPLLVGLDGVDKMSKSKGNAVGIDEPPLAMFEKLMSISDPMMVQYFELCTDIPLSEIGTLCNPERTHPKEAKKRLARDVVQTYHGIDEAEAADKEWELRHAQRQIPDDMPEFTVPAVLFEGAWPTVDLSSLLVEVQFAASRGEAKRLVQQGGVQVNGVKLTDGSTRLDIDSGMVLSVGRRKFVRLLVED